MGGILAVEICIKYERSQWMKFILWAILMSGLVLAACSHGDNDFYIIKYERYVNDAVTPDTVALGQKIPFQIRSMLVNGCEEYSHLVVIESGNDIYVTPIVMRDMRDQICTDDVRPINDSASIHPRTAGLYVFRFYRGDSPTLDKVVVVR
jgi:hypothetical protein